MWKSGGSERGEIEGQFIGYAAERARQRGSTATQGFKGSHSNGGRAPRLHSNLASQHHLAGHPVTGGGLTVETMDPNKQITLSEDDPLNRRVWDLSIARLSTWIAAPVGLHGERLRSKFKLAKKHDSTYHGQTLGTKYGNPRESVSESMSWCQKGLVLADTWRGHQGVLVVGGEAIIPLTERVGL